MSSGVSQNSATPHNQSTRKNALVSTAAIFLSRIMGLVREQVFAFFFGAGAVLDAFFVAFRIPNLLRDLFAEGALSQSFITIFSQKIGDGDRNAAYALASKVLSIIALVMAGIAIMGIIFAPTLVSAFATGFTGEKFDLTVRLMRLLFPFIFFVSLAALVMGILQAQGRLKNKVDQNPKKKHGNIPL